MLALRVYLQANVPNKVIACFAETGQTEKIILYSKKVGYRLDYVELLQHIMRTSPEKGAEFATQLVNDETGPLVDVERVRDFYLDTMFVPNIFNAGCRHIHVTEHDPTGHVIPTQCLERQ